MLVKMWSNRNAHSLLVGMQNGTITWEDSLVVLYKTKHTLTIPSSSHTPWYLPIRVENLCPYKNLHMDVDSSFIHNCQNLEATNMSFSRWMDKPWYIQTLEYYSVLKSELSRHEKTWRSLGNSLAVQWLGLCAFTAEGLGSIPDLGTKILQAMRHGQKKKKKKAIEEP